MGDWGELPNDEPTNGKPTGLPEDAATRLVRIAATRHAMQRTLDRLGNIPRPELAAACNAYALDFRRGETPLILVDSSLLRNAKRGLLLTSRALYSNLVPHPILLTAIRDVRHGVTFPEAGRLTDHLFGPFAIFYQWVKVGHPKAGLMVNERFVFLGNWLNWAFWTNVLTSLASASRWHAGFYDGNAPRPGGWG